MQIPKEVAENACSQLWFLVPVKYLASDQGQLGDLRAAIIWNETTLECWHKEAVKQAAAHCESVASGCTGAASCGEPGLLHLPLEQSYC